MNYYSNMATSLDCKDYSSKKFDIYKNIQLCTRAGGSSSDTPTAEKLFDDLSGCDQELPMDFQQLLESPESSNMSTNVVSLTDNKQPSFIQCGTNIISSIWSENTGDNIVHNNAGQSRKDYLCFQNQSWGLLDDESDSMKGTSNSANSWRMDEMFHRNCVGDSEILFQDCAKLPESKSTTRLLLIDGNNGFPLSNPTVHSSLITLNHNKRNSSFTEVIPNVINRRFNIKAKDTIIIDNENESTVLKKEEDLLTSMKTHFRPIKQEHIEIVPATAITFPDGTTFPISNSLDEPDFHKSPGGGLYLDSDINKKYMAFNDTDNNHSEFIPKFRVHQNEKFCQTEEFLFSSQNQFQPEEESYFSEDEKLTINMADNISEEEEGENIFWNGDTCIKVDGWITTWPSSKIWSNEGNVQHLQSEDNMWNNINDSAETSNENNDIISNVVEEGDQYTKLRNEWTQEAEELLSDISQQLYLANYMDKQPAKTSLVESAWNKLSATPFATALPITNSYSLMQS